eukprot:scpid61615/ scgid22064/ 
MQYVHYPYFRGQNCTSRENQAKVTPALNILHNKEMHLKGDLSLQEWMHRYGLWLLYGQVLQTCPIFWTLSENIRSLRKPSPKPKAKAKDKSQNSSVYCVDLLCVRACVR